MARHFFSLLMAAAGVAALIAAGTNSWIAVAVMTLAVLPSLAARAPVVAPPPAVETLIDTDPLREVKAAFAGFDSPVYVLDLKANVLYQNPSARHIFGPIDQGQHISVKVRMPVVADMIRDALASGRNGQVEFAGTVPSESVYLVRMVRAEATDGAGAFYVLIFRDISEARRIDRMRSDFVANASHELRTPLASLRGFIETLLGPARNDAKAQERFLNIMLEQVTRMSRLVDDLMSLSRLELKARLAPGDEVDLVPLLGSVTDALSPLAGDLGVDIRLKLPEEPVLVMGDRDELTQVFENLIENACKYGQEGKVVDVTLEPPAKGQAVQVSVVDYGPGIAEEHVPRLTERFYRANVESSRSKKGTGLGLAIVKHILTRHRARLVIKSELGKGSTFTVRF
ncbi:phosphate regulon sensor histidine kinase PhoR [Rhizobium sp. FKL33]|uniref:phosphate regulon sensor histidine kinase PhoR n=1 Tax=Rhizobium sp. FKL33 TaxID=2562307 RepID=UPI001485714E|nr:phosphate regulon sensor histidine kinase PhoR [Rhizobium sp. FKL33]